MTEIADQLVDEGEMDIYDSKREDFEAFAATWLPRGQGAHLPGAQPGAVPGGGDDDDDMFAEDDEKAALAGKTKAAASALVADTGTTRKAGVSEQQVSEYLAWPVKELKRFLQVCQFSRARRPFWQPMHDMYVRAGRRSVGLMHPHLWRSQIWRTRWQS